MSKTNTTRVICKYYPDPNGMPQLEWCNGAACVASRKYDCNGTMIFEHDIIRFSTQSDKEMCWVGHVIFDNGKFVVDGYNHKGRGFYYTSQEFGYDPVRNRFDLCDIFSEQISVVGDIFRNPDWESFVVDGDSEEQIVIKELNVKIKHLERLLEMAMNDMWTLCQDNPNDCDVCFFRGQDNREMCADCDYHGGCNWMWRGEPHIHVAKGSTKGDDNY